MNAVQEDHAWYSNYEYIFSYLVEVKALQFLLHIITDSIIINK